MKIKEFKSRIDHWMSMDMPIYEPEYKSRRGWRRVAWYVVHCMENWNRPF